MKIDQGTARALNRRLILNLLRERGALSRAEIAAAVGLSGATVTFAVGDLIEEGLLVEGPPSKGATGRRPIPVEINYSGLLAVGLKVMVGSVECVLTDLSTTPLLTRTFSLPDQAPETVADICARAVQALLAEGGSEASRLIGIGIAVPGSVQDGICRESHRFGWRNVPIASMLAERVHVPVWAEDDTNAFALAQQLFRLGLHHKTVGALAIVAGIGCAVIIEGAVHHGFTGSAGKIGHTNHDPSGLTCECGRRGCLQAHFAEPAIVARWQKASGQSPGVTRFDMVAAAQAGDTLAKDILAEAGRGIGRVLAVYCHVIDPEIIVVGGEAVAFGDFLFDPMRQALAEGMLWTPPPIMPDWVDNSWAQGAAALATRQIFDFAAQDGATKLE
ncbi:N-acetylglucosamine repressor [Devosia equisanguinis]|uniref:N-acetylglucosamine repressor n=2 Tax=Devosia equisanguinis TaxID=2490941 RepID=A0A447I7P0_9HYPH|nr:ROK family transcriptional regulator [Devosia equisanguinis]VDS03507.1 N-acetylglucosamine repressor [Devosia equisanguinis]